MLFQSNLTKKQIKEISFSNLNSTCLLQNYKCSLKIALKKKKNKKKRKRKQERSREREGRGRGRKWGGWEGRGQRGRGGSSSHFKSTVLSGKQRYQWKSHEDVACVMKKGMWWRKERRESVNRTASIWKATSSVALSVCSHVLQTYHIKWSSSKYHVV